MVKRNTSATIPLTKEELQKIKDNADILGMSMASYIRFVSLRGAK